MKPLLKVTGLREIDVRLQRLAPKVKKKIMRKAMRQSMKPILQQAKANAPVATGATKKAIKIKAAKRSRKSIGIDVRIGEDTYKGDQYYASFIEFGAPKRKLPPRPFIKPAYESKKDEVKKLVINNIDRIIQEETRKK